VYSIIKEFPKKKITRLDRITANFIISKRIVLIILGDIKVNLENVPTHLFKLLRLKDFSSIASLNIPEETFVWIINKNTTIYPKEFINSINNYSKSSDLIYFDEEFLFNHSIYPFLKPCWSPIYFSYNNIGNAIWIKFKLLKSSSFLTLSDFTKNISSLAIKVNYISEIISQSEVKTLEISNNFKPTYPISDKLNLVSIIVLTKDKSDYLSKLINSILTKTTYNNYEIIIVDHDSIEKETLQLFKSYSENTKIKIIKYFGEFNFSLMNNLASKKVNGSYLLFLNNDIEILENNWIERMMYFAKQSNIGIVGAKLLYPNISVQHCGIAVGIYSTTGHFQRGIDENDPGYMNTARNPREILAVTGACMLIAKSKFEEIQGFNEKFKVIFNDVDLCLKLYSKGYTNMVLNDLKFLHHEKVTRKNILTSEKDNLNIKLFWKTWGKYVRNDPYFNKHFSRNSENLD